MRKISEQAFINLIYPGIKSNPKNAFNLKDFTSACEMLCGKKPSKLLIQKATKIGVIKE